ncbi:MAG: DEAD/DEAH box helicase [Treponema sp.]|jgi:ATP-dependent RNA helicase RhlB|nr:DEAD/DEAH box helicase [Treponema sp.]
MEFNELNLHPDLQRGIAEAGYLSCMPVQEQVLAHAFSGQDLYVQSQTGTGKTAAFLVVIYQRLLTEDLLAGKKAIIMVPTRELAVQVEEEAKRLGKYLPFKAGSFYGGVGYTQQLQALKDNTQILVGTPGRVLDLNKSGRMNLMDIAFLILDEADRMFDMGFYPDLRKLIKVVPPADRRQTMLFSATLNAWVKNLAWEYTKNPFEIEIQPETVTVEEVEQFLYHVPSEDKMRLLLGILEREKPESAIIFCNTKRYTEIIAKRLRLNGYDCEFIIGDLPQAKRLKVIEDVKAGKIRFLAATDVAARGLDIEGLSMVINYDLPVESENYVHRIGRTARAGKTGKAITLASEQDVYELPDIERYIGKKIPSEAAAEELYAVEDRSSGIRIRSEFFGAGLFGGRDESGPRRGDRRDHRDREGREKTGYGRRDRGDRGRSEGPEGGRGYAGRDRQGRRSAEAGPGGEERSGVNPNIEQMPFEERMAYYRQKYHGNPRAGFEPEDRETGRRGGSRGRAPEGRSGEWKARPEGAGGPSPAGPAGPGNTARGPRGRNAGPGRNGAAPGPKRHGTGRNTAPGTGRNDSVQDRNADQGGNTAQGPGRNRAGRNAAPGARRNGTAQGPGRNGAAQGRNAAQGPGRNGAAQNRNAAPGKPPVPAPETKSGKGILGKILGIFKRGK